MLDGAIWEILTSVIFDGESFDPPQRERVAELDAIARAHQRSFLEQAQALVGPDAV